MSECEVLVLGDYFCDLIITGLKEPPRLGADIFGESLEIMPGGAFILTAALNRLGVHTRWMARLGNDLFSQFALAQAQHEGLDMSLFKCFDQPLRSMSLSFSFVQDRGFISHMDTFPDNHPEEIIELQKPLWVVNTLFDGSLENRRLFDFIHQQGCKVFTDCQYVTFSLDGTGLKDLLRTIDIFSPNLSEATQLTGETDPRKAIATLAEFCPLVVIKCGAEGAYAQSGRQLWYSPALKVEVIDTTGAGDCFNAGFLAAHLRGEPIEVCLRYGNICGGLSTTRHGGASAAPTLDQIKQYL